MTDSQTYDLRRFAMEVPQWRHKSTRALCRFNRLAGDISRHAELLPGNHTHDALCVLFSQRALMLLMTGF